MAEPLKDDPNTPPTPKVTLELVGPSPDMVPLDEWIAELESEPVADPFPKPVADYLADAREAGET